MGLSGILIAQIKIKSKADVFHDIIAYNPHQLSTAAPKHIQDCVVHEGEIGKVGSILIFNYFHDGKGRVSYAKIVEITEDKKSISFVGIEGDLKELYKSVELTVHVDTHGESNLATWTLRYEKLDKSIPHPTSLIEFFFDLTEDIETHHLKD